MFFETVSSPGLAHLSYVIGDGGRAAVIDPRRDVDVYLDIAHRNGAHVTDIFETHRNEDLVSGARELSALTEAPVHHGWRLPFGYGEGVRDGHCVALGTLTLTVLETPGHTHEHIAIVVRDTASGEAPLGVFTGDCLFIGSVGRTDFHPDRTRQDAEALHDSIFGKLLPLGDQAMLWPAHGAGSVCGSGMADRNLSTLGHERLTNPALQAESREAFVAARLEEDRLHVQPPYFREMERLNQDGPQPLLRQPPMAPVPADLFADMLEEGMLPVDVRDPEGWCGAHVPGAIALPLAVLSGYAGWVLPYDRPLGLIADGAAQAEEARAQLVRLGYERIRCRLDGGMHAWETEGRDYATSPAVHARDLKDRLDAAGSGFTLLDVRKPDELAGGVLPGSTPLFLGDLVTRGAEALGWVPFDRPVVTFCGSGLRAAVASAVLERAGHPRVETCLGSMAACRALGCPID